MGQEPYIPDGENITRVSDIYIAVMWNLSNFQGIITIMDR